jgi:hypothetical protein
MHAAVCHLQNVMLTFLGCIVTLHKINATNLGQSLGKSMQL